MNRKSNQIYSQILLIINNKLSERSETGDGADTITDLESRDRFSDGFNNTRIIRARDERKRGLLLVLPKYLEVVCIVQARRMDSDTDGGRRGEGRDRVGLRQGDRRRRRGDRHHRISELLAEQGFH